MQRIKLTASLLTVLLMLMPARAGAIESEPKIITTGEAVEASAKVANFNSRIFAADNTGFGFWPHSEGILGVSNAGAVHFVAASVQANTTRTTITCRDATFYRQYSPRYGPLDPRGTLYAGERVGWRHNYNGDWAVILHYRTAQWGYVLRRCLAYAG